MVGFPCFCSKLCVVSALMMAFFNDANGKKVRP